jgi:hypothetical protein
MTEHQAKRVIAAVRKLVAGAMTDDRFATHRPESIGTQQSIDEAMKILTDDEAVTELKKEIQEAEFAASDTQRLTGGQRDAWRRYADGVRQGAAICGIVV